MKIGTTIPGLFLTISVALLTAWPAAAAIKVGGKCELSINAVSAPSRENARRMVVDFCSKGLTFFPDSAVPPEQVTDADAEAIQLLAAELDQPLVEAASVYCNAALFNAHLQGRPGQLTNEDRSRGIKAQTRSAPWLSPTQRDDLERRIHLLFELK